MKRCMQCSEMLPADANFCPACGGKAESVSTTQAAVAPTVPDMHAVGGSGVVPLPRPPEPSLSGAFAAGAAVSVPPVSAPLHAPLPGGASVISGPPGAAVSGGPALGHAAVAPVPAGLPGQGHGSAAPKTVPAPPVANAPTPATPAAQGAPGEKKAAFRETLWFKKGELDEFLAAAKNAAANAGPGSAPVEAPAEDIRPLEDRYKDDGSVSSADREKFSLRTGATMYQMPASAAPKKGRVAVPGQRMSDEELIAEFQVGRGKGRLIAAGVGAVVIILILILFSGKKQPSPTTAEKPAAGSQSH